MAYTSAATRRGRNGAGKARLQASLEEAHTVCRYSKATKRNIPVKLTVV